jgi:hypothetical protein
MFGFQLASWWFFPWKKTQGAKYNIGILGRLVPWLAAPCREGHLAAWVGWPGGHGCQA